MLILPSLLFHSRQMRAYLVHLWQPQVGHYFSSTRHDFIYSAG